MGALFSQKNAYKKYQFLKLVESEQLACFDERDERFAKNRSALYDSEAYKASDIFVIATRFIDAHCDTGLKGNPTDADGLSFLIPKLKKDGKKIIILGNTLVLDRIEGVWLAEKIYADAVAKKIDFRSNELYQKYRESAEKKAYDLQSEFNLETNERLSRFSSENGFAYFERRSLFCDDAQRRCLVFDDDGYRLRYDYGHLTLKGKIIFGELLIKTQFEKKMAEVESNQAVSFAKFVPYKGTLRGSPRGELGGN